MGLFTPDWKGSNEKKALAQVEKFYYKMEVEELFQVAKEAPSKYVRKAAIDKLVLFSKESGHPKKRSKYEKYHESMLQADKFLRLLAKQDDEEIRTKVIKELLDIFKHRDYAVTTALDYLNTPDSINKALLHSHYLITVALLEKLSDTEAIAHQEAIAHLATTHPSKTVKIPAVKKLNDENILTKIAAEDKDIAVADAALKRLSLESSLVYVALNRNHRLNNGKNPVATAAADRLSSQENLADVAIHVESWDTSNKALERLNDQDMLLRVALESKNSCSAAVERLEDQEALRRVAIESTERSVQEKAVARIHNKEDLLYVIRQSPHKDIQRAAYKQMKGKGLLDKKTIAAFRNEIHDPVILEDLDMVCMERNLRKRIKGKKAEERVLRLLDIRMYYDSDANYAIKELGKHLDRDTIEALTLFLYRCKKTEPTKLIFDIMQRYYMDPTRDNELLAKMRLSRFNQMKPHMDDYSVNCEHSDIQLPPIIFPS